MNKIKIRNALVAAVLTVIFLLGYSHYTGSKSENQNAPADGQTIAIDFQDDSLPATDESSDSGAEQRENVTESTVSGRLPWYIDGLALTIIIVMMYLCIKPGEKEKKALSIIFGEKIAERITGSFGDSNSR